MLGRSNVERTSQALEASGATILSRPSPYEAPFEYRIRTPEGEYLDLVCYAFTANKYRQAGRPTDEHRFQVKYGSDFARYHDLYIDPMRRHVTLMYGVHAELGLFIAIDPKMHTPTWFSMSVEFKESELASALEKGWHGWERERSSARRKREMPNVNLETESVLAFRPEYFLRYAAFERVATGMDTGERLLLADRIERELAHGPKVVRPNAHPLEKQLGLSAEEILDVLGGSFRLLVAVRGGVAEHHLETQLRGTPGFTNVRRIDEDNQPDFEVTYRRRSFLIECKNVLRRVGRDGIPRVDFQKTRAAKADPCSRYYRADQFDVLAACLHPVTERWEYEFSTTNALPPHRRCPKRISERIQVAGENWSRSLPDVLDALL